MAEEPSIEPDQEPSSDDSDMEESEEEPDQEPSYSSDSSYDTDDSIESEESDREESVSNTKEINVKRFAEALNSKRNRQMEEEEDRNQVYQEDLFDFPRDPENWREEDLMEYWADGPVKMTKPGWDPVWADEEDWEIVAEEVKAGRDPPIAPFYVPFRKYYPVIPDNDVDIATPKGVIEELDRIEEFLKWVSYIFPDGSSYEGTVWDDLAHGKGVYVAEQGLVRYEGEWLQNQMEGHGVVEVDIPGREPKPGSKLEAKMRAQGKIISRDFMSPEDREWLEMDIEDMYRSAGTKYEIPFDESEEWIRQFGQKPEKGRYRYAGQWKHGRMHGCGVYEVNERVIYGRFYFGELLDDITGCDADISGLHAGIAEVAAAKARMFVNKPDGMIREERGPYGDPQHPYLYEDNEVWTAPGFINQFYEVPDCWKGYVQDVDQEREMWLNSFYKAPLRLPMPAELEYWWSKEESPEFVLVNKEPEPDPEDPTKLIYTEDPLILHTRTGRLINYIEDEENGVRLFWQPHLKEGENVDPEKAVFLPLGYDEFYGKAVPVKKENKIERLISSVEQTLQSMLEKLAKWTEEQKKACELNLKLIEQELEFREAELSLQEALEDMEMELKEKQKEEEKRAAMEYKEEERRRSASAAQGDGDREENEEEENAEETPWSFGSVSKDETEEQAKANKKENKSGKSSPFGTSSTSFASCSLALSVPSKLRESFLSWKKGPRPPSTEPFPCRCHGCFLDSSDLVNSVSFPQVFRRQTGIKAAQGSRRSRPKHDGFSQLHSLAVALSGDHGFSRPRTGRRRPRLGNSSKVKTTTNREENWSFLSFQVAPYCLEC